MHVLVHTNDAHAYALQHALAAADFSTPDASGSTSQAANIIESLEMGARVMLIDEDTAATNFMVRDKRMMQVCVASQNYAGEFAIQVWAVTPCSCKIRVNSLILIYYMHVCTHVRV